MMTETSRKRKRVVILGATGSIGESALKVARDIPDRMEIVGLAANRSAKRFVEQVQEVRPLAAAMSDPASASEAAGLLKASSGFALRIAAGPEALCELATLP